MKSSMRRRTKLVLGTIGSTLIFVLYQNCSDTGATSASDKSEQSSSSSISCKLEDGSQIVHSSPVILYKEQINANCAAISQQRVCNTKTGTLSGDSAYKYTTCAASSGPGTCSWAGKTYLVNQQVSAFVQSTKVWNKPSVQATRIANFCDDAQNKVVRTCLQNGTWSSSGFETCAYKLELPPSGNAHVPTLSDQIYGLYNTTTRRYAETAGFTYWEEQAIKLNWSVADISATLAYAASIDKGGTVYEFPASLSNENFVNQHYLISFGSESEQAGRDYWANQIATGVFTRFQIHGVINDALMTANSDKFPTLSDEQQQLSLRRYWTFFNRITAAKYFNARHPDLEMTVGSAAYDLARKQKNINHTPESLKKAYDEIDAFVP